MTTEADPQLLEYCRGKDFLLSKAVDGADGFKCLQAISESKQALEIKYGAKMGAGESRDLLEVKGFIEMEPLGAGKIIANEELCLHHSNLGSEWVGAYRQYAAMTKYGVLILAKTLDNFVYWANSKACREEVKGIPDGRLFAYLEHTEGDTGGRCGYIVSVKAQKMKGASTVKNGKGYIVWSNGNCYHGEVKGGLRNGMGKLTFASGDVYDGQWENGKKHGMGKFTWADGDVYDGEWENGNMHGKGKKTFASGNVYDGEWENDNMHGVGKFTWASGSVYDGEYENSKKHGKGKYTYASGGVYDGEWENDNMHGVGKFTYASGKVRHDGQWKDDKPV